MATKTRNWFDVDKEGLAKLIERRGAAGAVIELLQNAFDTNASVVRVQLEPVSDTGAHLTVEDDDPHGFADLTHAYTLFAESTKKDQAQARGRFNLGEKLVLALCDWATITTTTGTVLFTDKGREQKPAARSSGSVFDAQIRLNAADIEEVQDLVQRIFVPENVTLYYNESRLLHRKAERVWSETLPTEIAGDDGVLRATARKTKVRLFRPAKGEKAFLYELGIPVVELDGPFHVDVAQKIPLNFERNNVTPGYLRRIHLTVGNNAVDLLTAEQAAKGWIADTLADKAVKPGVVKAILEARYGTTVDKLVRFDPSDPQSSREATAQGYTVVGGRAFTPEQWDQINNAGLLPKAGVAAPSRNATEKRITSPDGEDRTVPEDKWTAQQAAVARYAKAVAKAVIGVDVTVRITREKVNVKAGGCLAAWYDDGELTICTTVGRAFWADAVEVDDLLIHEFAHHYEADHLAHEFHEACCRIGAKLHHSGLALQDFAS